MPVEEAIILFTTSSEGLYKVRKIPQIHRIQTHIKNIIEKRKLEESTYISAYDVIMSNSQNE